jgi:hypothetical protein
MDTSSDAKAAANTPNTAPNESLQISRMLVRAIWAQEWSAANPDAGSEARKAAWQEARGVVMAANLKHYRRALFVIGKMGVTMAVTPVADQQAADDGDNED